MNPLAGRLSPAASFGHDLVHTLQGTVVTLLSIVFIAAVVVTVGLLARHLRRRFLTPGPEWVVRIRDLAAASGEGDASTRVLTQRLLAELRMTHQGMPSDEEVDESEDLDGSPALNLRAAPEPPDLNGLLVEDIALKVGVVSTSVKPLLSLWTNFAQRPPSGTITGTLVTTEPEVLLVLETSLPDRAPERVEFRRRGPEAVSDAVRDAAAWVVVRTSENTYAGSGSDDWRSLREHRASLACLQQEASRPANRAELLVRARLSLQASLAQDPGNFLARFDLATVLRKLGQNQEALDQLEQLKVDVGRNLPRVELFVRAHASFRDVIDYNIAVVLTKLEDPGSARSAQTVLDDMLARAPVPLRLAAGGGGQPATQSAAPLEIRVAMLAMSARAAALAARLRPAARGSDPKRAAEYRQRLRDGIADAVERLEALTPATVDEQRRTAAYASAVAYTARARATVERGEWRGALGDLRRAITLAPDLVQAYLQLGELYLDAAGRVIDWSEQCEFACRAALAISPTNARAHNVLGRLFARGAVARYDEAILHFDQAAGYRSSLTEHARLLEMRGERLAAVALLRQSVARFPRPAFHFQKFVEGVERLAQAGEASREDIELARQAARALWQHGDEQLDKHLAVLKKTSP